MFNSVFFFFFFGVTSQALEAYIDSILSIADQFTDEVLRRVSRLFFQLKVNGVSIKS